MRKAVKATVVCTHHVKVQNFQLSKTDVFSKSTFVIRGSAMSFYPLYEELFCLYQETIGYRIVESLLGYVLKCDVFLAAAGLSNELFLHNS